MLRTVLRGWGYATDEADDGDTAVEKVKERAYDAVLRMCAWPAWTAFRPSGKFYIITPRFRSWS